MGKGQLKFVGSSHRYERRCYVIQVYGKCWLCKEYKYTKEPKYNTDHYNTDFSQTLVFPYEFVIQHIIVHAYNIAYKVTQLQYKIQNANVAQTCSSTQHT